MPTMTMLEDLAAFLRFVHDHPLGVVATVSPDGLPQAALVGFAATPDGDLLFNSAADARKIVNIGSRGRVAVVLGGDGAVSVQVQGTAAVLIGADRSRAETHFGERFPDSRVTDPAYALVRIRPAWLRRYDVSNSPPDVDEGRPVWTKPEGRG